MLIASCWGSRLGKQGLSPCAFVWRFNSVVGQGFLTRLWEGFHLLGCGSVYIMVHDEVYSRVCACKLTQRRVRVINVVGREREKAGEKMVLSMIKRGLILLMCVASIYRDGLKVTIFECAVHNYRMVWMTLK